MARVSIEIEGLKECIAAADAERTFRRPLRKTLREAGKLLKTNVVAIGRPVGRSLVRKLKVTVDRSPTPTYARVSNKAAWVNVAEVGRRAGAKMPPPGALRGGFAAARTVAARGLPGHGVMKRAAGATASQMPALTRDLEQGMTLSWNGKPES
jgi:hypothetical protein